ncbi:4-hydroxy-tetrahydrodipicolinate synthase [soil metagenome]
MHKRGMRFEGTYTALATPFRNDAARSIDWDAFDALIAHQLRGGITGLVPCGTTGESPAFTHEEHLAVIKRTIERGKGKAQIVAGTGSSSTAHPVPLSKEAEALGAEAVMVVVPYYNKPTQEGLYRHFVAVARAVKCAVVVYNVPGRSSVDLSADTLGRIVADAKNVVATKEATGNILRAQELHRRHGDALAVLCGDDVLTLGMIACGAKGVISVTSNIAPGAVTNATALALAGDFASAKKAHQKLLPLHDAMFLEANPGPVKAALAKLGIGTEYVRGPLAEVTEATRTALHAAMAQFGDVR